VVVDPGHHLCLGAVAPRDAAHHVHLPKLHGTIALEAAELVPTLATTLKLDQGVSLEAPVDARATEHRVHAGAGELVADSSGTPPRVFTAQMTASVSGVI
jgi:hypothetical protein